VTATSNGAAAALAVARTSLKDACDDLDDAVRGLPVVDGDDVMASPALLPVLLRVVAARRHLRDLSDAFNGSRTD
jgi:hypothetical protein